MSDISEEDERDIRACRELWDRMTEAEKQRLVEQIKSVEVSDDE